VGFLATTNTWESGFSVARDGRVWLAYNQGALATPGPDGGRMLVNSCAGATCMDLNTWTTLRMGAVDEGKKGTWVEGGKVNFMGCDAQCTSAANWQSVGALDDQAQMAAALPPDAATGCQGTSQGAAWWPRLPRFAAGDLGLVLMHAPSAVYLCPASGRQKGPPRCSPRCQGRPPVSWEGELHAPRRCPGLVPPSRPGRRA